MISRICVIVPAASEEDHIGPCLSSIMASRDLLYRSAPDVPVQVVVVLDSCAGGTAETAAAAGEVTLVPVSARCVGAARRAGAAAALTGNQPARELWLASTDADCEVPPGWLAGMLALATGGADLVLGTVLPGSGLSPALRARWLRNHQLRDGHPHVHGANLGIRGDAYLALGGWQPMVTGEDVDLAARACAAGWVRISRTAAIPVLTSVRQAGRAPRGFSSYLRAMAQSADPAGLMAPAD